MKNQLGSVEGWLILIMIAIFVLVAAGWVMNIVALTGAGALVGWGAVEILRVIGIFLAPIGAVMGWFV